MISLLRKLSSSGSNKNRDLVLTPKSLYKYLMRQCNRLPNPELQKYYKHQIRQSFIQHSDETEKERVEQITKQAIKDFDWILRKVFVLADNIKSSMSVINNGDDLDVLCSQEEAGFVLRGPVTSEFEFFYAVSVFTTRPHILNRSIKGAQLELDENSEDAPRFYSGQEKTQVPLDVLEDLKEPFLKATIDELRDLGVDRFTLVRRLIGHTLREYVSTETWDLSSQFIVIESSDEPNKELPPFRVTCSLIRSTVDEYIMEIGVYSSSPEIGSRLMQQSLKFYKERIAPKIIKWASSSSNNSLGHESHPNKAPGVPATSLKYVPVKLYYEEYKRLKDLYFGPLQSLWTENTDPLKFVSEEMGIAAYIKTYVTSSSPDSPFSFVDMGCGNGVLTFSLAACGASGFGFDIRPRKLWDVFSRLGINPDLRVQSFNPFCDNIQRQENLWLIGNHADELTPWVSVMARKFNANGFIVIPCCLFDFHGKFQRKAKNSCDAESLYQNYIHYIAEVGRKCGYTIKIDKLRIPSTKRVCIIGTTLTPHCADNLKILQQAQEYVNSKVSEFPTTDESIGDIRVFKPRSPIEKVNNLTQVDRTVVSSIVQRIFTTIMSGPVEEFVNHPEYLKPWNCGRTDLTLANAADLLSRQEKHVIQHQGKGLQTLMKNHHQIFRIRDGCVLLRKPIMDDITRNAEKSAKKVKTQNCYFNENHPDGCPLPRDICRFKH